jgi:rare lipoprotein A
LRPRPTLRTALAAGALSLTLPVAPAAAQSTARIASAGVEKKRMHIRAGKRVVVAGAARPGTAGALASLQIKREGRWRTLDRDRTGVAGRYVLRDRVRRPMSVPARIRVGAARRRVGRLNVYRTAYASWYGPGLYGNHLACGGTLTPATIGVAHKTLPCGTKLRLRYRGRSVDVRVIDRGPFAGNREFDLTSATKQRLGFPDVGTVLTSR